MCDFIHKIEYAHLKGVIFAIIGVLNGGSMCHSIYYGLKMNWLDDIPFGLSHFGIFITGVLYLTGVTFYINRIPEKYYPKKFDIWLNSHSIFHMFVFLAAVEFFFVMLYLSKERAKYHCVI